MRSWTQFQEDYLAITDDSASNTTQGGVWLNDSIRAVCNIQGGRLRFLERIVTIKTVAGRGAYEIPNKFRKVMDVWVTVGTEEESATSQNTIYMPYMIFDPVRWKEVLAYRLGSNDFPYFTYIQNQQVLFQPISSSDDNNISIRGRLGTINLSVEDYTTGSIVSVPKTVAFTAAILEGATSGTLTANWDLPTDEYTIFFDNGDQRIATFTNGSTAVTWDEPTIADAGTSIDVGSEEGGSIVTGTGTSWTAPMAGRYIRITHTGNTDEGDGYWYEIAEVLSSTVLTLVKPYTGTAVTSASTAYTIGQMSFIPEAYDIAPIYRAAALYWTDKGQNEKALKYWKLYDGGNELGLIDTYGGIIGQMLANEGETEEGSYVPPMSNGATLIQAPYYFPYQLATGFN